MKEEIVEVHVPVVAEMKLCMLVKKVKMKMGVIVLEVKM